MNVKFDGMHNEHPTNELRGTVIPQGTLSCPSGNSPCVGWKPQVSTLLCPCRVGKILFASQAKISRFKTDLSSLHNLMRSPALIQLLTNRGKHPLCHIQIPADLQLINFKRQVGWIPRLNI